MHAHTPQQLTPLPCAQPGSIVLICFANSASSLVHYQRWQNDLNDHIELAPIDVSGYGATAGGSGTEDLCEQLFERLQAYLRRPHALFGHNDGAHLAFEIAKRMQHVSPRLTRHLFVSMCDSPATSPCQTAHNLQVPVTALYPPGSLKRILGWRDYICRELELIELPSTQLDDPKLQQRLMQIINTHLGLLSL
ncbi:thioesterase domain-containing protein [Pseudomonas defluvii]|uniref:thioesterase domain-containing protein n=1 Tax=Pseudomonas defluvii TaxID=1876757 RepID=UPI0009F7309F|nr:thioesterase domain-containing protein [Pseudomonas defluvii]